MTGWRADFANDPLDDYDLIVDITHADVHRAAIVRVNGKCVSGGTLARKTVMCHLIGFVTFWRGQQRSSMSLAPRPPKGAGKVDPWEAVSVLPEGKRSRRPDRGSSRAVGIFEIWRIDNGSGA